MSYCIPEQIVDMQALLIAKRRDAWRRMRATTDPIELWALREYVYQVSKLIDAAFPIDHWWWWHATK